jgi:hypothetical protein
MTEIELKQIEKALNIKLPSFYYEFMLKYPEYLLETDAQEFVLMNDPNRIIEENVNAKENFWGRPLDNNSMVIGENGCGDYYLIKLRNDEKVYTFFHDDNSFYMVSQNIDEYAKMIIPEAIEDNCGNPDFRSKDMRRKWWQLRK